MPNTVSLRRSVRRTQGFTLIELMIVIAIIAILAGILIPNFIRARQEARFEASHETAKNIATALEMYAADNDGWYPIQLKKLSPVYLKTLPTCPWLNRTYYYGATLQNNVGKSYAYILYSTPHLSEFASGKECRAVVFDTGRDETTWYKSNR